MDLIARLKGMWRGHDKKLAEETLEAQSAGGGGDVELTPGAAGFSREGSLLVPEEHEEPEEPE